MAAVEADLCLKKIYKSGKPSSYVYQIIMSPKCSIGGILVGGSLTVDSSIRYMLIADSCPVP